MFQKRIINVLLIISILILASCATSGKIYSRYNNVLYETAEQALAAQRTDCDKLLSQISPTQNPVGGSAIFVAPSIKYIRDNNLVVYNGPAISDERKEQMLDYPTRSLSLTHRCDYELIEKRRIFDVITYTTSDDPESVAFNENYAILYFNKDGKIQYFVKRKSNLSDLIAMEAVSTALPPVQRIILWLDNIQEKARGK